MYQLIINKKYNIIENVFNYSISDSKIEKLIQIDVKTQSIIPNTENYCITLEEVPDNILANPSAFMFINNEYKIRPFLLFDILNKDEVLRESPNKDIFLILNKDINFIIRYIDPDNINFNFINTIYIQETTNFLSNIPNKIDIDNFNNNILASFKTKSRFPGLIKLKCFDNLLVCGSYPLEISFKDYEGD